MQWQLDLQDELMPFRLFVTGPTACFPRPEFRYARVSYDVMTPLAAMAILNAVHVKPSIRWIVERIHVLRPIKIADAPAATRHTADRADLFEVNNFVGSVLLDVAYVIEARFELTDQARPDETTSAHSAMFQRRAKRGGYRPPYLGMPGFAADIRLLARDEPLPASVAAEGDVDLGWMIYDLSKADGTTPRYFRALLSQGTMNVPTSDSPNLRA